MPLRIIDNKRVELTDDEFRLFGKLCESYKEYGGASLFQNLFETNNDGIILFLKPPSTKFVSWEIFMFLISVFQQQHMRLIYTENMKMQEEMINRFNQKIAELNELINQHKKDPTA